MKWHTQAAYNKLDNWVERNRVGLEKIKEQLQTIINNASHNKSVNLQLEHDSYRDRDGEPIVWHESVLDRSWDQLENEIDRKSQLDLVVDIHHIKITNVEMRKERLAALAAKICNGSATNSCTFVDFDNANLCEEGIVYLSKLIDFSSQLRTLYLLHNRIDNMDSASSQSN